MRWRLLTLAGLLALAFWCWSVLAAYDIHTHDHHYHGTTYYGAHGGRADV